MATAAQIKKFIDTVAPLAVEECRKRGYGNAQAWTCVAQSCCETGYGTSALMLKANAFFGIKATSTWKGKVFSSATKECYDGKTYVDIAAAFRAYDNCADSVKDYFDFIEGNRYRESLSATTVKDCITIIKNGGYATSPTYINTITTIYEKNKEQIESYKVENVENGGIDMKYSDSNPPYVCMQTNSTCYKATGRMAIVGVLFHSTGANNPTLKRYVQPHETDSDYAKQIAKLGKNTNRNDWNHIYRKAGLNAWIGKFADGSVGTVQTMPWDYKPWGCGAGSNGSCNNGWIQFEICEDDLKNQSYFEQVYKEACELTAYLCKKYNINPNGTVTRSGVKIPTLTCHNDAYKLGFGSGHGDINHWFPKYGKNMQTVREDVAKLMVGSSVKPVQQEAPVEKKILYRVQIGAFKNKANAESYAVGIEQKGFKTYIKKEGEFWKVQVGAFSSKANAESYKKKVEKAGYACFITLSSN